jgi:hypothetical protein
MIAESPGRNMNRARSSSAEQDESLCDIVRAGLRSSPYRALWRVDCRVDNGVAALFGTVPSFFHKQIAQSGLLKLERISGVKNYMQVQTPT